MQILEASNFRPSQLGANRGCGRRLLLALAITTLLLGGCGKDPALAAIESDAYGFQCLKCKAKFFTGRKSPLGSKCPKCHEDYIADAIGYWCEKDKHLTIRLKVSGPEGAAVCEQCGATLKNAMISPKQNDLVAWGATKAGPP